MKAFHFISKYKAILVLALLIFGIAITRISSFNEPIDRDIGFYAVVGHELNSGKCLYSDIWANQPPVIHVINQFSNFLFGATRYNIYILHLCATAAVLVGVYAAAQGSSLKAGLWGSLFFALVSSDLAVEGNQPNTEIFMNLFVCWGLALMMRVEDGALGWRRAIVCGALFALATLLKQIAILIPVALCIVHIIFPPKNTGRQRACFESGLILGCVFLVWAVLIGVLYLGGRLNDFWDCVVVFNKAYAGNIFENLLKGIFSELVFPKPQYIAGALILVAVIGAGFDLRNGKIRPWAMLLGCSVGIQFAVSSPGMFYPHYYQLWLPIISISAGMGLAAIPKIWDINLGCLLGIVLSGVIFLQELLGWTMSSEQISRKKFGSIFVESNQLGLEIKSLLNPDEKFFQWGSEAQLYFTAQRWPASGILFDYPTLQGPDAKKISERVVSDLSKSCPELVVIMKSTANLGGPEHPITKWVLQNYSLAPERGDHGSFYIFIRKNGNLEKRWRDHLMFIR